MHKLDLNLSNFFKKSNNLIGLLIKTWVGLLVFNAIFNNISVILWQLVIFFKGTRILRKHQLHKVVPNTHATGEVSKNYHNFNNDGQ